jgi:DNA-binding transcriptional regulator YhcF (GntR family)
MKLSAVEGVALWYRLYLVLLPLTKRKAKLPTEQALMKRFECSRNTVRHALRRLRSERRIVTTRGSGSYPRG